MATLAIPAGASRTRPGVLYPHAQWYFLLAIVITWIGFARSYFAVLRSEPLLHHIHGALMGGWIVLLIVQPVLYQRGHLQLHRTLGRWGAFLLLPAMLVVGAFMVRSMLRTSQIPPFIVTRLAFLDICSMVLLPTYVGLAIYHGRKTALHARWITCTVLLLMPPAVVRAMPILPVFRHSFVADLNLCLGLMCGILLLLMLDDWRKDGRVHAPYRVALGITALMGIASNFVGQWPWWQALTAFIRGA